MSLACEICKNPETSFSWTDTHGVVECRTCGVAYQIYHYDENKKRVDKPARCCLKPEFVAPVQEYWDSHQTPIYNGKFLGGPGSGIATEKDAETFHAWLDGWCAKNLPAGDSQ